MNAYQAVTKLEKLKDEISALDLAFKTMEVRNCDSYFIRIIGEMREAKLKYKNELESVLKDTELPKQF